MENKKSGKPGPIDRHLDTPAEANRDKHINFVALENGGLDPVDDQSAGKLSEEKSSHEEQRAAEDQNHTSKKTPANVHLTSNPRNITDSSSTSGEDADAKGLPSNRTDGE